jgi:hypothetical protein
LQGEGSRWMRCPSNGCAPVSSTCANGQRTRWRRVSIAFPRSALVKEGFFALVLLRRLRANRVGTSVCACALTDSPAVAIES